MKKTILMFITILLIATPASAFSYKVKNGDTLWRISNAYGVTLKSIIQANPQLSNPNMIYPNQIIEVPTEDTADRTEKTEVLEVINIVNQERAKQGLPSLSYDAKLTSIALTKAQDMKKNNYFSHTSPTYGSPFQMLRQFGVTQYKSAGENIAKGQRSPQEVMTAWMNSSGHRANILNKSYTKIGVGYVADGKYWVQLFVG